MDSILDTVTKQHQELLREYLGALPASDLAAAMQVAATLLVAAKLETILRQGIINWPGEI